MEFRSPTIMPIPQPSFDSVSSPMEIDGEDQHQQEEEEEVVVVVVVAERNRRRRTDDRLVLPEEPSGSSTEERIEGEEDTKTKTKKKMRKLEEEKDCSNSSSSSSKVDRDELCCVICTDPWTSQGDHHVCCLPCGHLYGMSCIHRWILQHGRRSKCPQCNTLCSQTDIRKIYASPVYIDDDEDLKKKVGSLVAEVATLKVSTPSVPHFGQPPISSPSSGFAFNSITPSSTPSAPHFGQPPISSPSSGFAFNSITSSGANPFQFGGQQNPATIKNPCQAAFGANPFQFGNPSQATLLGANPFQFGSQQSSAAPQNQSPCSGSLDFNAEGSLSLGTGGGDKSNRKMVKVRRNPRKK